MLTPSPKESHTDTLIGLVREIMRGAGVSMQSFRSVDREIAPGVYPALQRTRSRPYSRCHAARFDRAIGRAAVTV